MRVIGFGLSVESISFGCYNLVNTFGTIHYLFSFGDTNSFYTFLIGRFQYRGYS